MTDDEGFLQATMGAMDLVYNIARRMVPRPDDAQDLVQETYLAANRAWTEHRRPQKVEPWLATICLNLGLSGFRHRARRPQELTFGEAEVSPDSADPEREAIEVWIEARSRPLVAPRRAAPGHRPGRPRGVLHQGSRADHGDAQGDGALTAAPGSEIAGLSPRRAGAGG